QNAADAAERTSKEGFVRGGAEGYGVGDRRQYTNQNPSQVFIHTIPSLRWSAKAMARCVRRCRRQSLVLVRAPKTDKSCRHLFKKPPPFAHLTRQPLWLASVELFSLQER